MILTKNTLDNLSYIKTEMKRIKKKVKLLKSVDIPGMRSILKKHRHLTFPMKSILHELQKLDFYGTTGMKVCITEPSAEYVSLVLRDFPDRINIRAIDKCRSNINIIKDCIINPNKCMAWFNIYVNPNDEEIESIDDDDKNGNNLVIVKKPGRKKRKFEGIERMQAI